MCEQQHGALSRNASCEGGFAEGGSAKGGTFGSQACSDEQTALMMVKVSVCTSCAAMLVKAWRNAVAAATSESSGVSSIASTATRPPPFWSVSAGSILTSA